ncbi:MAG: hypothetical protein P1U85_05975 [Verrucomicrobiales bacterium]|nr:hypothetical protein [Verrucomicrobiales bacterium]
MELLRILGTRNRVQPGKPSNKEARSADDFRTAISKGKQGLPGIVR